ncbi:15-hydroxyprostaglandin dehydrogenase [NAD(+)]-like [Bombyx mandarina]|uniref:15-hydroxyprostaglandin dehydrogenase [NAD(+)]-like n=1 Tax=Bombyx mandarina TaxID=7092 RepID=A0A6J2JM91_BOMMA|nr:15-hydroxyprostaglandin dehydrogenase [NAD(+)]-like [Bombyx mandarina]
MYDLKDKVVIITGGANGIGESFVQNLLEEDIKFIAILDTDVEAGEMLQDKMMTEYANSKVKFIQCDVTVDEELFGAFDDVVKEIGYIDLVINNAGIANESDPKAIRKEVEVNYIALVNGTLKSLELMRKDKGGNGGTIVNISSIGCMCQHAPALFVYMGTKSAVLQFSNCIGREEYYSKTGVRILTVCFGITKTGIYNNLKSFDENINKDMQQIIDLYPMQSKESAAKGAIEAIKKGESGSTWLVAKDSPAVDVTSNVNKAYKILSEPLV